MLIAYFAEPTDTDLPPDTEPDEEPEYEPRTDPVPPEPDDPAP